MEVLELTLRLDERASSAEACADYLHRELRAAQWRILAQLAAAVVARYESGQQGQRMVFLPAAELEAEALRALALKPAG